MSSKQYTEPAPINSSYVVLFHLAVLFVAPVITAIFPSELRLDALMISIVFPILLFWLSYVIRQFVEPTTVLRIIVTVAFVVAILSFFNARYGGLADGSVPIIYTHVPFFANLAAGVSGSVGLIYAGTVLVYGAYTYIFCVAIASLLETGYSHFGVRMLPRWLQNKLIAVDSVVDRTAQRASDNFFVIHQSIGLLLCAGLIGLYAVLYILLLIIK